MKNKNLANMERVVAKVREMFSYFKVEYIIGDEYYLVLLLLSLYRDEVIGRADNEDSLSSYNLLLQLLDGTGELHIADEKKVDIYKRVFPLFAQFVNYIEESAEDSMDDMMADELIIALLDTLFEIDRAELDEHFAEVFDMMLGHIDASSSYPNKNIRPKEFTRLMMGLTDLQPGAKIYNPFAGMGSFALYGNKGHSYIGQEINHLVGALGLLRLMAYDRHHDAELKIEHSIDNWGGGESGYDLVVASPPFALGVVVDDIFEDANYKTAHEVILGESAKVLNDSGQCVCLLSAGALTDRRLHVRELYDSLVENDFLDMVILLQDGMIPSTGVVPAIVVLSKKKAYPGKVRFIQGGYFVDEDKNREKILRDGDLLDYIATNEEDGEHIRFVDNSVVVENDFNLHVPLYFLDELEGVPLGDYVEDLLGDRVTDEPMGKHVRIRDLSSDSTKPYLDLKGVEDVEITRSDLRRIDRSCLLLSAQWLDIKPTYFEYKDEPIYIAGDIYAFVIDEEKVVPEYLVYELASDEMSKQFDAYRVGGAGAVPRIRRESVHKIVVDLPSIDEQRRVLAGIEG